MSNLPSGLRSHWPTVDCSDWPEPFDAFPVEVPFQVRPDLVKLVPADDWLRVDRQWPAMLEAKWLALAGDETQAAADNIMLASRCDPQTERRRQAALAVAIERLAATAAGRRLGIRYSTGGTDFGAAGYRLDTKDAEARLRAGRADAEPVVQAAATGEGARLWLCALAMSLQEDLVLMEQGPDGVARAALLHVSFPSAWNPAAKVGQDLLALHAPVADNAALQAAAPRLGNALVAKGPFVRWVWTVTADSRWRAWPARPELSDQPDQPESAPAGAGRMPLYFRLERQTTMPLGDGYGLFLIRVQVMPLQTVLAQPGRLGLLQESLRSMSGDMVRYKNLAAVRRRLLDRQLAPGYGT